MAARPYPAFHPVPLARLGLSMLCTCWTLARVGLKAAPAPMVQAWATRVLRALGVQVAWAGPVPPGGQLWVSNHLSWLDPLVYLSLRPSRVIAKVEVAGYPAIGPGAKRIGVRFVRRGNLFSRASTLRALGRDLRAGDPFLVFPEGTTTDGGCLAPLREGALKMAYRQGVTVLPLRLTSDDAHYPWVGDAELFPHLRGVAWSRSTRVEVHPGPVLVPAQFPSEAAWLRAIRAHLETPVAFLRGIA